MNNTERLELAQWAVDTARRKGADHSAVTLQHNKTVDIEHRARTIDKLQESTENSLSIQVYVDGRYSAHNTSNLNRESLELFIDEAVRSTCFLSEDRYRKLPDPELYENRLALDLQQNDPQFFNLTPEERIKIVQTIEESALAFGDKVISAQAGWSDNYCATVQVHSDGFCGATESTSFSGSCSVSVRDEDERRPEDYAYAASLFFNQFPSPDQIGKEAAERALQKVGQHKIASGRYEMLVENRVSSELVDMLIQPLFARNLQQKNSCLEDMLGKPVASELLTLTDNPLIQGGFASRLFDSDGISAKVLPVIEKGVLQNYYIGNYYGRKLEKRPTTGSPSNLIANLGKQTMEQLMASLQKGILVKDFIGGNFNSTTGDFSFGIMGMYIENGQVAYPINEMNISGNLKELWKQLVALGNDPYAYSSWKIPTLHFTDVSFSGV